ncbi:class I adenylate-forming enzyme family protein [Brenneria tiliae]|uniref:Acyl--CoA ligase n=1 Tax=Brenneria tiliae TaxID=2914984 RepID=A0ABT0MU27_9GAMM|nr:class I adenylate-forming enzyme family protein [Brenneria tiliae]MCL2893047.1 acyl--CoA ligase [Brenneria tiliae]
MSIFSDFKQIALRRPDAPAVVMPDGGVAYSTLLNLAEQIAGGLLRAGLRAGDRVAIHIGNRPELISVYYACLSIGAVFVPISLRLSGGEVKYLIAHSAARFYLGDRELYGSCSEIIEHSDTIEQAWVFDLASPTKRTRPWTDLLTNTTFPPSETDVKQMVSIFYTSGTTGQPKGIVYSQATLNSSLDLVDATIAATIVQDSEHPNALYSMVDLISPWTILMTFACLRNGRPLALTETQAPDVALQFIRRKSIGWIFGTPSTFNSMLTLAKGSAVAPVDLSETHCISGGDACPTDLSQEFFHYFRAHLQGSYGQTEAGGPMIYQPDLNLVDEPSIGWPLPGVGIRIDRQSGESGELLLRSPAKTVGIWNGKTVAPFDEERWIATGDVVQRRSDGCLLFLGRKKDLMKVEGYPVSPLEVEQELLKHPDIADVVVFGIPDPTTGERPIAMIQTKSGRQIDEQALLAHLSGHIAHYKHPREFIFTKKLPILPSGKLGRQQLAASYIASHAPAKASLKETTQ